MKTKICCRCNIEKNMSEFNNSKRNKDGKSGICKLCNNNRGKKYRTENPDKVKEQTLTKYYKDVEKSRERNNLWKALTLQIEL